MNAIQSGQIHPTAIVAGGVSLGSNVTIGAYSIVHENVSIGDDCVIGTRCTLGEPLNEFYSSSEYVNPRLEIGARAIVRSEALIYAGSSLGTDFQCGHRVTLREGTQIGHNVRIGTLSDVQGNCRIGNHSRLHSNVFIAPKSKIGDCVWIFPHAVLTNDPTPPSELWLGVTVEDFAVIAAMSLILPGVRIGRDALVGAMSLVHSDVPAESVVVGNPARIVKNIHEVKSKITGELIYPWRYHFERGMPWQGIGYEQWLITKDSESHAT